MLVYLFLPWVNTLYWHDHKIELVGDLKIILIVLSAGKDVKIWAGCQKALQSGRGTYHNTELSVIAHGMQVMINKVIMVEKLRQYKKHNYYH